jgi:hypothetical protein
MEKTTALQSEKKAYAKLSQRRDHRVVSVHPEFERNYFRRPFWQLRRFSTGQIPRFHGRILGNAFGFGVREP